MLTTSGYSMAVNPFLTHRHRFIIAAKTAKSGQADLKKNYRLVF